MWLQVKNEICAKCVFGWTPYRRIGIPIFMGQKYANRGIAKRGAPNGQPLPAGTLDALRATISRIGVIAAAEHYGVARSTLASAASGSGVRRGTAMMLVAAVAAKTETPTAATVEASDSLFSPAKAMKSPPNVDTPAPAVDENLRGASRGVQP